MNRRGKGKANPSLKPTPAKSSPPPPPIVKSTPSASPTPPPTSTKSTPTPAKATPSSGTKPPVSSSKATPAPSALKKPETPSEKLRKEWKSFEGWLNTKRSERDKKLNEMRAKAKPTTSNLSSSLRRSLLHSNSNSNSNSKSTGPSPADIAAEEKKLNTELCTLARKEWEKKIQSQGLNEEDWLDITPREMEAVEEAFIPPHERPGSEGKENVKANETVAPKAKDSGGFGVMPGGFGGVATEAPADSLWMSAAMNGTLPIASPPDNVVQQKGGGVGLRGSSDNRNSSPSLSRSSSSSTASGSPWASSTSPTSSEPAESLWNIVHTNGNINTAESSPSSLGSSPKLSQSISSSIHSSKPFVSSPLATSMSAVEPDTDASDSSPSSPSSPYSYSYNSLSYRLIGPVLFEEEGGDFIETPLDGLSEKALEESIRQYHAMAADAEIELRKKLRVVYEQKKELVRRHHLAMEVRARSIVEGWKSVRDTEMAEWMEKRPHASSVKTSSTVANSISSGPAKKSASNVERKSPISTPTLPTTAKNVSSGFKKVTPTAPSPTTAAGKKTAAKKAQEMAAAEKSKASQSQSTDNSAFGFGSYTSNFNDQQDESPWKSNGSAFGGAGSASWGSSVNGNGSASSGGLSSNNKTDSKNPFGPRSASPANMKKTATSGFSNGGWGSQRASSPLTGKNNVTNSNHKSTRPTVEEVDDDEDTDERDLEEDEDDEEEDEDEDQLSRSAFMGMGLGKGGAGTGAPSRFDEPPASSAWNWMKPQNDNGPGSRSGTPKPSLVSQQRPRTNSISTSSSPWGSASGPGKTSSAQSMGFETWTPGGFGGGDGDPKSIIDMAMQSLGSGDEDHHHRGGGGGGGDQDLLNSMMMYTKLGTVNSLIGETREGRKRVNSTTRR
ncbi:hypothetical protein C8Q75DRAFT_730447 [Abortiporus biennis]|nr:hypothetical protein C8Q75DRAFT_730447 [Abortiporus biennis]